jgi:phosphopantothenoylcysteine decarboxylase/phosphopantothenate--cysteine ligase
MAPAMNAAMWENPAVQRNVSQLTEDGVGFIQPASGWLSCRQTGIGRMAEPETIITAIETALGTS